MIDINEKILDKHLSNPNFIDSDYLITFPSVDESFYELGHFLQLSFLRECDLFREHTNGNNCFVMPDMNGVLRPVPESKVIEFEHEMEKEYYQYVDNTLNGVYDKELEEKCTQELYIESKEKEHKNKSIVIL